MAKTLKQVLQQIDSLQKEAASLRAKEVSGVIERIKDAIKFYSLTPEELFGKGAQAGKRSIAVETTKGRKAVGVPMFSDGAGNTWTGRGTRPAWFLAAIASGRTKEELMVPNATTGPRLAKKGRKAPAKPSTKAKRGGVAKFTDGAGRTWSGVGKRPGWFVAAIEAGKSPEDLLIKT